MSRQARERLRRAGPFDATQARSHGLADVVGDAAELAAEASRLCESLDRARAFLHRQRAGADCEEAVRVAAPALEVGDALPAALAFDERGVAFVRPDGWRVYFSRKRPDWKAGARIS